MGGMGVRELLRMVVAGRGWMEGGQSACRTICKMWFICLLTHLTQCVSNTNMLSLNVLDYR